MHSRTDKVGDRNNNEVRVNLEQSSLLGNDTGEKPGTFLFWPSRCPSPNDSCFVAVKVSVGIQIHCVCVRRLQQLLLMGPVFIHKQISVHWSITVPATLPRTEHMWSKIA